jgi:hypothetical protein
MIVRTKQDAGRVLADTPHDKCFLCHDGCVAQNLHQLADCLSHISTDSFRHHANDSRNDFANWVRDVFGDDKLAKDLAKAGDRKEAAEIVRNRIAWLKKKL